MEGVLTGDSDDKRESFLGQRDGLDKFCESFGARLAADLRNGFRAVARGGFRGLHVTPLSN